MVTDPRFGAAAPAGQAQQRRHPAPSLTDQLQRAQGDLDLLLRDAHAGILSQAAYDGLEERAQAIAAGINAAFRSRPEPRPVNPPIGRTSTGGYIW